MTLFVGLNENENEITFYIRHTNNGTLYLYINTIINEILHRLHLTTIIDNIRK